MRIQENVTIEVRVYTYTTRIMRYLISEYHSSQDAYLDLNLIVQGL